MKRVVKPKGLFAYPSQSNRRRKTKVRYVSKAYREYLEVMGFILPLRMSNAMLYGNYTFTLQVNYWSQKKLRDKQEGKAGQTYSGDEAVQPYDRRASASTS